MSVSVALHTIGQTPRPDLTPFIMAGIGVPDVVVTGALDGLPHEAVPAPGPGEFPLETRLSDGTRVEVGASFLEPRIQAQINAMEDRVQLHLVLCAGPFPGLVCEGALVRPFEHACDVLSARGVVRPQVLVPFAGQSLPAEQKWVRAGFAPLMRSMDERPTEERADNWLLDVSRSAAARGADAVILDYVGYPRHILQTVQNGLDIPVIDLGHLATDFARSLIDELNSMTEATT